MKPPQSYHFRSIYPRVCTKITQSYPFWSIYLIVRTKITPYDTHQPTLMSPRYSNVTLSIRELIIRYASSNFRFIILNPTQRTSKSAQGFYRRNKDNNMHQPPCIDYPNVTSGIRELSAKTHIKWINMIPPLSPRVFIARHTSSDLKSIKVVNPIKRNLEGKTQFTTR